MLSDEGGRITEVVIHYVPSAADVVLDTYREFLGHLPDTATVYAVTPTQEAFDDLRQRLGPLGRRLTPIVANHAMTTWSRDRWLAFEGGHVLSPHGENGAAAWSSRAGDSRIGADLARALPQLTSTVSGLYFDGGDFVADATTVFVTPRVLRRNLGLGMDPKRLVRDLENVFDKRVVLLDRAPDHHAGMFMMVAGQGRMLVGDPSLARSLVDADGHDFSDETQALFDAVARQVEAVGYRVVRIPVAPGNDGRTYETPLNALLEQGVVYMPVYDHTPRLNAAAASVWRDLGFEVRTVNCTRTFVHFGSLRCLVNVLARATT